MGLNSKHIATFLFGAAAGFAATKYATMTPEEKEKFAADLKDKATKLKDEAESFADNTKNFFEELKVKGTEALKEHFQDAEKMMNDLFSKKA